jgi:hypothetical protein
MEHESSGQSFDGSMNPSAMDLRAHAALLTDLLSKRTKKPFRKRQNFNSVSVHAIINFNSVSVHAIIKRPTSHLTVFRQGYGLSRIKSSFCSLVVLSIDFLDCSSVVVIHYALNRRLIYLNTGRKSQTQEIANLRPLKCKRNHRRSSQRHHRRSS